VIWWDGGGITQVTEDVFENTFVCRLQITSARNINGEIVAFPISRDVTSGDLVSGRPWIALYTMVSSESYRTPMIISCFNNFIVRRQVIEIDGCLTIENQTPGLNIRCIMTFCTIFVPVQHIMFFA
jgi:hypothetical protein